MLNIEDTEIEAKCQQYNGKGFMASADQKKIVMLWKSHQETERVKCPRCGGRVNIDGQASKQLRDIPVLPGQQFEHSFLCHRYRCLQCKRKHTEEIPFREPGIRITERAARWIEGMLRNRISIRAIQEVSRIHWDVIRHI